VSIFVTGTDTGVGKTSFTTWLLQRLRERGVRAAGYKPICCGDRADAEQLLAASCPGLTIDQVNPVWLKTPAAPMTAALEEKRETDVARLREGFRRLSERVDFVAVEGVGGWMVPITAAYFMSDFAGELRLPVVVVVLNKLGCLNHTLLTVRSIEGENLKCAGVVLNSFEGDADIAVATNAAILRSCIALPMLERFDRDAADIAEPLLQMMPEIRPRV